MEIARSTLPNLEDKDKYVLVDRVPVFGAVEYRNPKTGQIIGKVDDAQLERLCRNSNERAEGGDLGMAFIGHTDPNAKETDQPPHAGYMKNYRIGQLNGRKVVLADMYIKKQYVKDADDSILQEFPRRSAEVSRPVSPDGFIDAVALTKRTPKLQLGVITHTEDETMDDSNIQKTLDELMRKIDALTPAAPTLPAPAPVLHAENASPSPTNTYIPDAEELGATEGVKKVKKKKKKNDDDDDDDDDKKDDETGRHTALSDIERHTLAIAELRGQTRQALQAVQEQQARLDALAAENANLRKMNRTEEVARHLADLQAQGYQFSLEEEAEQILRLTVEEGERYLERIRRNYMRAPLNQPYIPVDRTAPVFREPPAPTPEQFERYLQEHRMGKDGDSLMRAMEQLMANPSPIPSGAVQTK